MRHSVIPIVQRHKGGHHGVLKMNPARTQVHAMNDLYPSNVLLLCCLADLLDHLHDCRYRSIRLFDLNHVVAVFCKQLLAVGG